MTAAPSTPRAPARARRKRFRLPTEKHLLQSARRLLERYLPGVHARLRELPEPPVAQAPAWARQHTFPRTRSEAVTGQRAREERRLAYERVKELRRQGRGIATIARELKINRQTVRKYAYARSLPERGRQAVRESRLDPFLPYLHARWEAGCENASQLWREIQELGYTGTKKQVLRLWEHQKSRTIEALATEGRQPAAPRGSCSQSR